MSQEVPSAVALPPSNEGDRVRISPGLVVAGALAALAAVTWFRNWQEDAALRERTAERLRSKTEAN
jgi:hypothetical protein